MPNNREEVGRLEALAEHIAQAQYDIVCLQEFMERICPMGLFDPAHRIAYKWFLAAMRRHGFLYQLTGPSIEKADSCSVVFDGGIAIFSKYPFKKTELIPWADKASWDAACAKGIAYACIEVPSPTNCPASKPIALHVVTLHAQAKHVGWMDLQGKEHYQQIRPKQMQQLADVVSLCAGDDEAVLALGDFNFDARDSGELAAHQSVLEKATNRSGPRDIVFEYHGEYPVTFAEVDCGGQPVETFLTLPENLYANRCLDHIYFWPPQDNSGSRVSVSACQRRSMEVPHDHPQGPRWPFTHMSDHYGWAVELLLDKGPCTSIDPDHSLISLVNLRRDIESALQHYQTPKCSPSTSRVDLVQDDRAEASTHDGMDVHGKSSSAKPGCAISEMAPQGWPILHKAIDLTVASSILKSAVAW